MRIKIRVEVEHEEASEIYSALLPDIEKTRKFDVRAKKEGNEVVVEIVSESVSGAKAGVMSLLKLFKVVEDVASI
jgi:tRNA threonylcarbamoyladenosine modification (KEOPS) complex  Pcc1 subunit